MTRDEFIDALGISRDNPFARATASALRFRTGANSELGASRIGGLPDLPVASPGLAPDQDLVRRDRPDDLAPELSIPIKPLAAQPTWTFPLVLERDGVALWRWDDPEMEAAFERLESIHPEPWNQVGGHPHQIQATCGGRARW
ncbi:MAG: hypothetical protein H6735_28745 [Alphaproteobacteria bacterium]|nr:hypothetical protein [Alphaproteobacteria bacterium]